MSTEAKSIFKSNLTWKILTYFLTYPSKEVYVKELAQLLKVGPSSANNILQILKLSGLLLKQERARSHFYSLNNESTIGKYLKIAYFLERLQEVGIVDKLLRLDEGLISLCLYGSYADGKFDEKSDIDLLAISQKDKSVFNPVIFKLESALKIEINLEVFSLLKWKRIKVENKGFHQEIMSSHILLFGSEIF